MCAKGAIGYQRKKIEVIEHHLDLRERAQQTPEYLSLNPNGYVPTLVDNGKPIVESCIICEYLDEVFTAQNLSPLEPVQRAYMRTWTRRPDAGIHMACATLTNAIAFRLQWLEKSSEKIEKMISGTPDPVRRDWRREMIKNGINSNLFSKAVWSFDKLFLDMELALKNSEWLCGEMYTHADVALTPYLNRVAELQLHFMWEDFYPIVTNWFERARQRNNFILAFFDYPYPTYKKQMAEQGARQRDHVESILGK